MGDSTRKREVNRRTRTFNFLFQAEDRIRDRDVTGVQTCALPIWVMVGYKDRTIDRVQGPTTAILWRLRSRHRMVDLNRPEQQLIGVQFTGEIAYDPMNQPQIGRAACRERGENAVGDVA